MVSSSACQTTQPSVLLRSHNSSTTVDIQLLSSFLQLVHDTDGFRTSFVFRIEDIVSRAECFYNNYLGVCVTTYTQACNCYDTITLQANNKIVKLRARHHHTVPQPPPGHRTHGTVQSTEHSTQHNKLDNRCTPYNDSTVIIYIKTTFLIVDILNIILTY